MMSDTSRAHSPSQSESRSQSPEALPAPEAATENGVRAQRVVQVPPEVKDDLKEYVDLQEQIKGANQELKVFKERLKELSTDIAQYMAENGLLFIDTPRGKVSFYQSKAMKPINKDYFKEALAGSKITDQGIIDELTSIFDKRPFTEVSRIKVLPRTKRSSS